MLAALSRQAIAQMRISTDIDMTIGLLYRASEVRPPTRPAPTGRTFLECIAPLTFPCQIDKYFCSAIGIWHIGVWETSHIPKARGSKLMHTKRNLKSLDFSLLRLLIISFVAWEIYIEMAKDLEITGNLWNLPDAEEGQTDIFAFNLKFFKEKPRSVRAGSID
ncbi:hypothetical protein CBL_05275 [Carabus blaptoides fortunei]